MTRFSSCALLLAVLAGLSACAAPRAKEIPPPAAVDSEPLDPAIRPLTLEQDEDSRR